MRNFLVPFLALALASCGEDETQQNDDDVQLGEAPAAPSSLSGMVMGGGIHLTWHDNSEDETEFHLERADDDGAFALIYTAPFNTTQYHDGDLTSGVTYHYRISSKNDAGTSDPSSEFSLAMP